MELEGKKNLKTRRRRREKLDETFRRFDLLSLL
jgi:hypothetical protein